MTQKTEVEGTPGEQQVTPARRLWHAPKFSLLDIESTESGVVAVHSDSGSNHMS